MIEVRWHGRGGQGAVTSVELLAQAAINEGKFAQGFPAFGAERRGAPVVAYNRIDDHHIRDRSPIIAPDFVVCLDETLLASVNVTAGLKPEGTFIINTQKSAKEIAELTKFNGKIATVDATSIAWKELGVPITNTTILGALLRVLGMVKLESLKGPVEHRFGRIANKNMNAMTRAYNEVKIN